MGFAKLINPNSSAAKILGEKCIRVTARSAAHNSRFIRFHMGNTISRLGSLTREKHKVHVMLGDGQDKGHVAVVLDDTKGQFVAKRQKDETYVVTVPAEAAKGLFKLEFPPFTAEAKALGGNNGTGPAFLDFEGTPDFFA